MIEQSAQEFGTFIDGGKVSAANYYLHLNRYRFSTQFIQGKHCLDIGCGTGYGSMYLARKGAHSVTAGDYSKEAIAYAKKSLLQSQTDKIDFQILNATFLPFQEEAFDTVISFEIIEHLKDYRKFISEARRVLINSGTLVLSTPNRQAGPFFFKTSWNHHHHEFTPSELINIMSEGFEHIEIYGQYLLSTRQLLMKRLIQTVGRSLDVMKLNPVKDWLGRMLLPHNRLMVYRTNDFDRFEGHDGEVVSSGNNLTPISLVIVAKNVRK
ncbi:MAG: class I SAM-dependent methyltransferase [Dehalococcoidales bacterium]|nr:class I SAM-dependent methyltransferase [Dehalococcoidales bacterium]